MADAKKYEFTGKTKNHFGRTQDGPRIIAGCRYFTFAEAEKHWRETRGGTPLGDESLAIVTHLRAMAKINGADKKVLIEREAETA